MKQVKNLGEAAVGQSIKVIFHQGSAYKETRARVVTSSGVANFPFRAKESRIDFKKEMLFDPYIKKFMPKPCEIVVKNINTNQILSSATLQLTDHIDVELTDWNLPLGGSVIIVLNLKSRFEK